MNIQNLSPNILVRAFFYLNGIELSIMRATSKKIRDLIDSNENFLFHRCMFHEYGHELKHYEIPGWDRVDWKNIYIISNQYFLAQREIPRHTKIVGYAKDFEGVEKVIITIELFIAMITGLVNLSKISIYGWSASRALIREFMESNPGTTLQDAILSLDLSARGPATLLSQTYNIDFI